MHEMIARGNFRNNAAEFFMLGNLRSDLAGEEFVIAKNGNRSFVTGGFKGEDCLHRETIQRVVILSEAKDLTQAVGSHN